MVNLSVEVHCLQPIVDWEHPVVAQKVYSKYRIYINDDLITERDWVWDQNTYIHEQMLADISLNLTHTVRIDILNFYPGYKIQLGLSNLIVNDILHSNCNEYQPSLTFMLT
jgi:hypothetical protein